MSEKDKTTKQLKRALAALDTAVQKWYEKHNPIDKQRYATCHIRDLSNGRHVSNITLNPTTYNKKDKDYICIASSKEDN